MYTTNSTFNSYGTTVFELMSRLAVEHKSINLGQGFPDDYGPNAVLQKASEYLFDLPNQYPPMLGVPELRRLLLLITSVFMASILIGKQKQWSRLVRLRD